MVSSLMLWEDQSEMRTSGLRFEKLRTPLLFLLELLAVLALVTAAANPRVVGAAWSTSSKSLILVLDDSYSMQAAEDKSPRDLAINAVRRELPYRWRTVSAVLAGDKPQTLGQPVETSREMLPLLEDWRCSSSTSKLRQAIGFAAEIGGPSAQILVLTDRQPTFDIDRGNVQWWAFGKPLPNRALVNAARSTRPKFDRAMLEVANYSGDDDAIRVRSSKKGVAGQSFRLQPGQQRRVFLRWKSDNKASLEPFEAWLDSDALSIDDRVYLASSRRRVVRVQIDLTNNKVGDLVKKAVEASGKAVLTSKRPHLLITDQTKVSPDGQTWIVQLIQEEKAKAYLGPFLTDRSHALTRGLTLEGVVWGAGESPQLEGVPIITAGNIPLLTASPVNDGLHVRWRLRADLSTLPESPAWPVLVWNLLDWRSTRLSGVDRANVRLGESLTITTADPVETVSVKLPDDTEVKVPVQDRQATFRPEAVGLYKVTIGSQEHVFGCNALSAEESDLSQCDSGRWGKWRQVEARSGFESLTWILLLFAAAVLTLHLFFSSRGR